jgi:hypothetical protein
VSAGMKKINVGGSCIFVSNVLRVREVTILRNLESGK